MGDRKLQDHGFGELEVLASTSVAAGDYIPVFDASANEVKKVAANEVVSFAGVTSSAAELNILDGVTATKDELNMTDVSLQTETIVKAGVVSVTKKITKIDSTTGTGAITLAAPDASMLGQVKTIIMAVDGGDITLALTNVQGQSSGTTATFNDVSDALILVGGISKWHVIGESGITLS